ncbi:MAG TPA: M15 family metallopeptidase [Candidatus Hydrogenedentes bacterium]|nr:M15 family metallopeptidase [Candidatus Hydrogenedentota bacterium]MDY0030744.1 M15 family metallopeptidase [FCB group bacterium]NLT62030.1 M15 family metallopeptidase [Candidatus Hydrogenedentota bacterium]HNV20782.1 M15 family metallopeptidase [Candidatus Hydrogenedentota bacterium]HNZ19791.1 M15 family metallopeptidase [Candidatus Hydrogenedentota bacterium]
MLVYTAEMLKELAITAGAACALGLLCAGSMAAAAQDVNALDDLVRAYPDHLVPAEKPNTVLWKDGTEMVFDDGIQKAGFEDLLNRASLKDQMAMPYPRSWPSAAPLVNADPGRVRNDAFFRKMYGGSADEVRANLVSVEWLGGARVPFSKVNGAAEALGRVREELETLPAEVYQYVAQPVGTFAWRPIAGTARLSMHSFGAAIDFQLPRALYRYWKWDMRSPNDAPVYPERMLEDARLRQVVAVFERHGFIWGGKWFHYDTMHFEYRPELLG